MAERVGQSIVSCRVDEATRDAIDRAAREAGQSRAEWISDAIRYGLAIVEHARMPKVVRDAIPERVGNSRMRMPPGRTFERRH